MATYQHTIFVIYRIVCFVTGKCYIGRTNDPHKREGTHWSHLHANTHHNNKLQRAFNKYGRNAFYYEQLERDIPQSKIDERETFWIAHFDSYHNGYNLTGGGHSGFGMGQKKCAWNGIEYLSITAAAHACGVGRSEMRRRFRKGYTCDADMPGTGSNPHNTKAVTWNNIEYPSIAVAARARGISNSAMQDRIEKGYVCDSDIDYGVPCEWNGIKYSSIEDCAKANGITGASMNKRIQHGHSGDSDIKKHFLECVWNGIIYPSHTHAAKALGITKTALGNRLKAGYTCDSEMYFPHRKKGVIKEKP